MNTMSENHIYWTDLMIKHAKANKAIRTVKVNKPDVTKYCASEILEQVKKLVWE